MKKIEQVWLVYMNYFQTFWKHNLKISLKNLNNKSLNGKSLNKINLMRYVDKMYGECDKGMKEMKKLQKSFDEATQKTCRGELFEECELEVLQQSVESYEASVKVIRSKLLGMDKFIMSCCWTVVGSHMACWLTSIFLISSWHHFMAQEIMSKEVRSIGKSVDAWAMDAANMMSVAFYHLRSYTKASMAKAK